MIMKKLFFITIIGLLSLAYNAKGQIVNSIVTGITGDCPVNCTTFGKMFDNDLTTTTYFSYSGQSGCDLVLNITLSGAPKAVRIKITADRSGFRLTEGNTNYYTTQKNTEEFYYVNPLETGFNSLVIKGERAWGETRIYEIEVFNVPIENVALNYGYDAAGNMTSRLIVIGSAKTAEIIPVDTTEIVAEMNAEDSIPGAENKSKFEELLGNNRVTIYPNPTKGQLRVALSDISEEDKVMVNVYSLAGTRIYSGILKDNLIDLNNEASGVYILEIVINDKAQNWRIVKE